MNMDKEPYVLIIVVYYLLRESVIKEDYYECARYLVYSSSKYCSETNLYWTRAKYLIFV